MDLEDTWSAKLSIIPHKIFSLKRRPRFLIIRKMEHDADEIIPGVWVGNLRAAADEEWLRSHGIVTVFNCTKQLPFHSCIPYQYRVPVDDNLQAEEINNMERWGPEIAYKIWKEYNVQHPILIHCHAGMQRSTTACAFFLMALTHWPLIKVMSFIKEKRPIAFDPRPNFAPALRGFEGLIRNNIS